MPNRSTSGEAPIELALALAEMIRGAALPGASGRTTAQATRLWEHASDLVRGQAAVLLAGEGTAQTMGLSVGDAVRTTIRLPRSLALATLASAQATWVELDPGRAQAAAAEVLRRLVKAGYDATGLEALDVISAVWMMGGGHPIDAATRLLLRAEEHLSNAATDSDALLVGRGLLAAGRRRQQLERHGLILPAEVRAAIGPLSYSDVTRATGAPASAISVWLSGTRRVADHYALWLLDRLEAPADRDTAASLRSQSGPKRKNKT